MNKEMKSKNDEKDIFVIAIDDKVELYAAIWNRQPLKACRITFKEINLEKDLYKQDEIGDGLLTMTIDQAKNLRDQLSVKIEEIKNDNS